MQHQSPRPAPRVATFLRSAEVAAILQVCPKTVARWAQQGRYPKPAIRELAASLVQEVRI